MRGCAVSGFASGFANAAISFSGPPVAIYALYVGWDKDTTRGTLSLYFLGISICTCIVQAAAAEPASTSKAKQAGKMMRPAMSATNVSSSKMWMDSPVRERCLSM